MPAVAASSPFASTPELSFAEGQLWCELIESRCGLHFPESQWHFLRRRLWERMQQRSMDNYAHYYRLLTGGHSGAGLEWKSLMEDLLNPETNFFRHQPSFEALQRSVLARWRGTGAAAGSDCCRLWSAGCSTGEEAYSLAMTALANGGAAEVLGSDLNGVSLERARRGRYASRQISGVPAAWRSRYFRPAAQDAGAFEAAPALRAAVSFAPFHLLDRTTYPQREFDVIFCFNVLVYFRRPARQEALAGLLSRLRPGGHLFLAPGETAGLAAPGAEPARFEGTTVLRRAA